MLQAWVVAFVHLCVYVERGQEPRREKHERQVTSDAKKHKKSDIFSSL